MFRYILRTTGDSGYKYGPCEVCHDVEANYKFFTDRARFNLIIYKIHLRDFGKNDPNAKLEKSAFLANMKSRLTQEYLNDELKI